MTVTGHACTRCGYRGVVDEQWRCPDCGSDLTDATFTGSGAVWSWTVVHPAAGPPVGLAHVDLDDGPRMLARFDQTTTTLRCGTPVEIHERDGMPHAVPTGAA